MAESEAEEEDEEDEELEEDSDGNVRPARPSDADAINDMYKVMLLCAVSTAGICIFCKTQL